MTLRLMKFKSAMNKHLQYLRYLLRHKFWVAFYLIRDYRMVLQAITHDWSKFLPDEWFPYVNYFYGPKPPQKQEGGYKHQPGDDTAFDTAWNHHQKRQPHHYQYWLLKRDDGTESVLPMPEHYLKEMLCDWRGAGRAQGYGDNTPEWYERNKERIVLHPDSRKWIEAEIARAGKGVKDGKV